MKKPLALPGRFTSAPGVRKSLAALLIVGGVGYGAVGVAGPTDDCAKNDHAFKVYGTPQAITARTSAFEMGAAAVMGLQGYDSVGITLPGEFSLLPPCMASTPAGSQWLSECSPLGMGAAMTQASMVNVAGIPKPIPSQNWLVAHFAGSTGIADAQAKIAQSLVWLSSPALVPMRGRASEWGVIDKICAKLDPAGNATEVQALHYFDIDSDSEVDELLGGFTAGFYKVVTKINAGCDPHCTGAAYFNEFVIMYDPPPLAADPIPVVARPPKGVVAPGQLMTAELAQSQVWQAVDNARFVGSAKLNQARRTGAAAPAYRVHGIGPEGQTWEYFVVPIRADQGRGDVITFITLAAADGAVMALYTPKAAQPGQPLAEAAARERAATTLHTGERLLAGVLTYDVMVLHAACAVPSSRFMSSRLSVPRDRATRWCAWRCSPVR